MKRLIIALLFTSLITPILAVDPPTKKKSTPKAEAKTANPSGKADALAKSLSPSEKTKLLDLLNQGDDEALQSLPGIGATRATAIKKARPFTDPVNLVHVDGIGDNTLAEIIAHAKAGFPVAESKETTAKPKTEAKKKTTAKKKAATPKKTAETVKKAAEE